MHHLSQSVASSSSSSFGLYSEFGNYFQEKLRDSYYYLCRWVNWISKKRGRLGIMLNGIWVVTSYRSILES